LWDFDMLWRSQQEAEMAIILEYETPEDEDK
jgi:hypothetical protein